MKRYAVKAIDPRGFVVYIYHCPEALLESTKYWASEWHEGCAIEVEVEP